MSFEIKSLDNISPKVLEALKAKYEGVDGFIIKDHREDIKFGKRRERFLFGIRVHGLDYTFVWVGKNLRQLKFTNLESKDTANYQDPLAILNFVLNN